MLGSRGYGAWVGWLFYTLIAMSCLIWLLSQPHNLYLRERRGERRLSTEVIDIKIVSRNYFQKLPKHPRLYYAYASPKHKRLVLFRLFGTLL